MAVNTQWGELLVGAYHQRVTGAEVVSYNNRSEEQGDQMEADVIAVNTDRESGDQTVHVCEVVTHLDGGLYSERLTAMTGPSTPRMTPTRNR